MATPASSSCEDKRSPRYWTADEDAFLWQHGPVRAASELSRPLSSCWSRQKLLRERGGPDAVRPGTPAEGRAVMAVLLWGLRAGYSVDHILRSIHDVARQSNDRSPPSTAASSRFVVRLAAELADRLGSPW